MQPHDWVTIVATILNASILLGTAVYVITATKENMINFKDALKSTQEVLEDHSQRIVKLETFCKFQHERENA